MKWLWELFRPEPSDLEKQRADNARKMRDWHESHDNDGSIMTMEYSKVVYDVAGKQIAVVFTQSGDRNAGSND